jgi:hypothetical protein
LTGARNSVANQGLYKVVIVAHLKRAEADDAAGCALVAVAQIISWITHPARDIAAPNRPVRVTLGVIREIAAFGASVEDSGLTAWRDSVPPYLPIMVKVDASVIVVHEG